MDEVGTSGDEDIFGNVKPSINSIIGNQLEIRVDQNIFAESNLELKEPLRDSEKTFPQPAQTTGQDMDSATFDCQFCKEKIAGVNGLDKHLRNVHNAKVSYTCHVCQLKIWRINLLKRHLRSHENKKRVKSSGGQPKESTKSKRKRTSKNSTKKSDDRSNSLTNVSTFTNLFKENIDNYHQSQVDSFGPQKQQSSKALLETSAISSQQHQPDITNSNWPDFDDDDGGIPDDQDDDWGWDTDLLIPESIDPTTTTTAAATTWVSNAPSVITNTRVKSESNVPETTTDSIIMKINQPVQEIVQEFSCRKCTEVFHSEQLYEIHQSYHNLKISADMMCPKCDKRVPTAEAYRSHLKNSHRRRPRGLLKRFVTNGHTKRKNWRNKKRDRPCAECGQVLRSNFELKIHMQRHTGVKLFRCEQCGRGFAAPASLKRHQRKHLIALLEQDIEPEPLTSSQKSAEGDMKDDDGDDDDEILPLGLPTPRVTGDGRKLRTLKTVRYDMDMHPRTIASQNMGETKTTDNKLLCPTCQHVSSDEAEFKLHMQTHTGVKLYKCLRCDKNCTSRNSLIRHIRLVHTDIKPHPCTHCSKTYASEADLRSHLRFVTLAKSFPCTFGKCNKSFAVKSHLLDHMRRHTGERPFHCDVEGCGKSFMTCTEIRRHAKRHLSQAYMERQLIRPDSSAPFPFMCQICGRGFEMEDQFRRHCKTHDPHRKTYPCNLCGKKYFTKGSLTYHSITHEEEKNIPCPICLKKFQTPYSLSIHQRCHLNRNRRTAAGGQICELCGKRLGSVSGLKAHMERHMEAKKYICEQCGKGCATKGDLKFHTYTHAEVKPFKCDFCDFRCTHPSNINHHVAQDHMGAVGVFKEINVEGKEANFICSTCGEGWTTEKALEHHQIYHRDESSKDVRCKKCKELFFTKYDLWIHAKSHRTPPVVQLTCTYCSKICTSRACLDTHVRYRHTGETPFPCTECDRKFKSKQDLKYHSYTHSGAWPFSCSVCGKRAGSTGNLNAHMRTHQKGTVQIKCPQCDETFKNRNLLRKHSFTHHKGEGGEEGVSTISDQLMAVVEGNNTDSSSLSSHHQGIQESHQTTTVHNREIQDSNAASGFQLNYSQFFATW